MTAIVDQEMCTGCTLCTQVCPDVFKMEEDTAVAYVSPVPESAEECSREAEEQCPVDAITMKE